MEIVSADANDSNPGYEDSEGTTVVHVTSIAGQPQYVLADGDHASTDEDSESRKRREILARRPSYRRILNELSATDGQTITVAKIEEESNSSDDSQDGMDVATNLSTNSVLQPTVIQPTTMKMVQAGAIQLAAQGDGAHGLQTLTMTNVSGASAGASPTGATIVQYAQAADGQFLIPVSTISAGNVQYQIAGSSAALPQGVVMATGGNTISSSQSITEDGSRKRELRLLKNRSVGHQELRLLKNREAARECRRKKKEYVKCLENRVAVLENQNKTLIEELKSLKELYCQKEAQS